MPLLFLHVNVLFSKFLKIYRRENGHVNFKNIRNLPIRRIYEEGISH